MAENRKPNKEMCSFCHEKPVRALGLCLSCYRRASRNGGDPSIRHRAPKIKKEDALVCRICGKPALNLGLCREHYEADLERRIASGEIQPTRKLETCRQPKYEKLGRSPKPDKPKAEKPKAEKPNEDTPKEPKEKRPSAKKKEIPQWVQEMTRDIFGDGTKVSAITEKELELAMGSLDKPHELALRIKYQGYKYPNITAESKEKLREIQREALEQIRKRFIAQGKEDKTTEF